MTDVANTLERRTLSIAGAEIELFEGGQGAPLLFLHSGQGVTAGDPFLALLAKERRVIAPSHPGFGKSSLPDWADSVDDMAHIYLELMDRLDHGKVDLVGCSIGGWIAAEIATKVPERIKRLVMIGPVGVKIGTPDKLDIPDVFAMPQEKFAKLIFHDPDKFRPDLKTMPEEAIAAMVRNRETLALIAWEPYMHNPKLKHRLHRVTVPALFVRGESDGLVSAQYLQGYAGLLPDARTETIAKAGHSPQLEQPQVLLTKVLAFLNA
ncbi:MAG: alpha/beta fold hydrolase [Rhizobiales bacterium]|nr:alpha/beta fold hydrolase [Hyphomicrobiales bacterium]